MVNVHFAADTPTLAWQPNHTFRGYPQLTASKTHIEEVVRPFTRAGA